MPKDESIFSLTNDELPQEVAPEETPDWVKEALEEAKKNAKGPVVIGSSRLAPVKKTWEQTLEDTFGSHPPNNARSRLAYTVDTGKRGTSIVNIQKGVVESRIGNTRFEGLSLEIEADCLARTTTVRRILHPGQSDFENQKPWEKTNLEKFMEEELGLADIGFRVLRSQKISGQATTVIGQSIRDEEKAGYPKPQVVVLLNGWTGSKEIFHKGKQKSLIKDILETDPNAIVVEVDLNGFGESKFRSDISIPDLAKKTTIDYCAHQVDFVLRNVLEIPTEYIENAMVIGHSMGGATALELAARGYGTGEKGKVISVAPAALPKRDPLARKKPTQPEVSRPEADGVITDTEVRQFQEAAAKVIKQIDAGELQPENLFSPDNLEVRKVYAFLAGLLGSAAGTKLLENPLVLKTIDKVTEEVFSRFLGPKLMGTDRIGDLTEREAANVFQDLSRLHKEQLVGKTLLSAVVMFNLARGIDPRKYTREMAENMAKALIVYGENDNLGGGNEVVTFTEQIAERNGTLAPGISVVSGAGHYMPLYSNDVIQAIRDKPSEFREKVESRRRPKQQSGSTTTIRQ